MNLWGLWVFGAAMIAAMAIISWRQTRAYRTYLARHAEETAKCVEQQRALTQAVNRIAEALEKRS